MSESYDFNDRDMWEGQLILHNDGWFEGIVKDPYGHYHNDIFIFGAYFPYIAVELLKVTPAEVSDPFVFKCEKNQEGYAGRFSIIDALGEQPFGVSYIVIQKSMNENLLDLQTRIGNWKSAMQGDNNIILYENTAKMRKEFCEILRRKYTGKTFTDEEMNKIREATDPIENEILGMINKSLSKGK